MSSGDESHYRHRHVLHTAQLGLHAAENHADGTEFVPSHHMTTLAYLVMGGWVVHSLADLLGQRGTRNIALNPTNSTYDCFLFHSFILFIRLSVRHSFNAKIVTQCIEPERTTH